MDTVDDRTTLKQDAALAEPLRRVAYEAGMMLGLEATRDEQAYHRRRLSRHQYWFQGYGTLAGMRVSQAPATHANSTDDITVRLLVSPGIGIDRLGREVLIHEPYCVNLKEWVAAQRASDLQNGYDDANDTLWLKVYVRQQDCPVAQQPVLARKLNLSTDAVQPSRTQDSVRLELVAELPDAGDDRFTPWGSHPGVAAAEVGALDTTLNNALTATERATLSSAGVPANDGDPISPAAQQLLLHTRLLFALDDSGVGTQTLQEELASGARLLLAHIALTVTDIDAIVVNPHLIAINNLVRPFLTSASQLAWLARQG